MRPMTRFRLRTDDVRKVNVFCFRLRVKFYSCSWEITIFQNTTFNIVRALTLDLRNTERRSTEEESLPRHEGSIDCTEPTEPVMVTWNLEFGLSYLKHMKSIIFQMKLGLMFLLVPPWGHIFIFAWNINVHRAVVCELVRSVIIQHLPTAKHFQNSLQPPVLMSSPAAQSELSWCSLFDFCWWADQLLSLYSEAHFCSSWDIFSWTWKMFRFSLNQQKQICIFWLFEILLMFHVQFLGNLLWTLTSRHHWTNKSKSYGAAR